MRVTRTSGLPLESEDIAKYKEELDQGMMALTEELGRFEKLPQDKQGIFIRRFEEMKKEAQAKYVFETEWDFETVVKSKTKLKENCNRYGVIAFARSAETNQIEAFIIDSKF
jgi:hypothetical protein